MKEKGRNKGGRPKIDGWDKKKFEIKCNLNFKEMIAFDNYKSKHNLKKAEVVRKSVLKELKIRQKKTEKLTPEILKIMTEIRRTNHSLNQIAKSLNTGLPLDGRQTIEYLKLVHSIKNQTNEIIEELKK